MHLLLTYAAARPLKGTSVVGPWRNGWIIFGAVTTTPNFRDREALAMCRDHGRRASRTTCTALRLTQTRASTLRVYFHRAHRFLEALCFITHRPRSLVG